MNLGRHSLVHNNGMQSIRETLDNYRGARLKVKVTAKGRMIAIIYTIKEQSEYIGCLIYILIKVFF